MNRRILLAALPALALTLAALPFGGAHAQLVSAPPSTPQDQTDIAAIQTYLNGVKSLKARFLQVDASGNSIGGNVWMMRPGRMRFEYDPPDKMLLVAGHGLLVYYDPAVKQTTNIFLSSTPLGLLLQDNLKLSGDVTVTGIARAKGQIQLTIIRTGKEGAGSITLIFATDPMTLRSWIIRDAQGRQTQISLYDVTYGGDYPNSMFTFVGPQFEH
ncbi:outer membrane lipoprotein carrier protein LolA [Acidisoma cellulosilytica]|uniref:Outer membrane lipoprotein carrier protein LolA n=1 Tax=Acidisoma cellulosilyticum TaxID=2802395 RepID=A0A963Z2R8_9PROT|nr:outer membrane lipoprotein carrier protein LolA [Acidisoma cellulosilyticum]MCB8880805.1 outer membrane lipoprotein carrier protein LolA [Acidisoma cellulosilyticum]